ncbi:hypothetical protein ACP4OV_001824 [Aristida adscensionis]
MASTGAPRPAPPAHRGRAAAAGCGKKKAIKVVYIGNPMRVTTSEGLTGRHADLAGSASAAAPPLRAAPPPRGQIRRRRRGAATAASGGEARRGGGGGLRRRGEATTTAAE